MTRAVDEAVRAALACVEDQRERQGSWRATVLDTPNGNRLVVEVSLEHSPQPDAALIAKSYQDDTGAETFRIMLALHAAIATRGASTLAVPEALSYDVARRCVVQRRAPGQTLASLLGRRDAGAALRAAGAALAELHALEVPAGRAQGISDHLAELIHPHPLELARRVPEQRSRIESLVWAIEVRASEASRDAVPRPLHRDVHPRQLLVHGGGVWMIDWDLFAQGDPALDVGNFLMCLETSPLVGAAAGRDPFLDGYLDRGNAGVESRIPVYKALAYLRRASKHCRLAQPGWATCTERMLRAAERCLDG
jgi:aminoglycoside phosphotransferase (APT) family kinase protein